MFGGRGESAVRERGVPANQTSLSSHVTSLGAPAQTPSSKHPQLLNRGTNVKRRINMDVRQHERIGWTGSLDDNHPPRLSANPVLW